MIPQEVAYRTINEVEDQILHWLADIEANIGRDAASYVVKRLELALEYSRVWVEESGEVNSLEEWDGQTEMFAPWETLSEKED